MKYAINAPAAPESIGPYSQGTTAGSLAEADCTLSDVAQTTLYLANLDDLDAVNRVYERYFVAPAPARTVVEVSRLPMGALVEMDCVACR